MKLLVGCVVAGLGLAGIAFASAPPPLIGLSGSRLVALDPRTLEPLPSPRPLNVGPIVGAVPLLRLSPDGSRLAILRRNYYASTSANNYSYFGSYRWLVVDRSRLRLLRSFRPDVEATGVWDAAWSQGGRSFVFIGDQTLGTKGVFGHCGHFDIGNAEFYGAVAVRTPSGVVVMTGICGADDGPLLLTAFAPDESDVEVEVRLDPTTFAAAAVDAHRDRLFLVSSGGTVAVVNLRTNRMQYHAVALPVQIGGDITGDAAWKTRWADRAAWAGAGHLAVWGPGGLVLIDTRDWSASLVDPTATDVGVASNAVIAWNRRAATGLTVYAPDGSMRFRALAGHKLTGVGLSARYAYATGGGRFSVDLRSGRVTGPLRSSAMLILPDLRDLP